MNGVEELKSNPLKVYLFVLVILLLSACNKAQMFQHIEVFVIETSEQNNEGIYETTGFKKINAITTIEEGKSHLATDIKAIEDFYDIDGSYIKTEIMHSEFNKSKITLVEDGNDRKEELSEPSTILIPDYYIEYFQLENMTMEEKKKVEDHVLSFMDKF